jgi:hypothetical protein
MLRSPTGDRLGESGEENAGKKPKKRPPCLLVPINCGTWLDDLDSLIFYASWCINRQKDGGLELPLKMVSERMGHSSIAITANVYGHLFPTDDDGAELKAAEKKLLPA